MTTSAAADATPQQHVLARTTAIFAAVLLLISLGQVWFRVGGGSKGRLAEVTGLQSLLIGLGNPSLVRPRGGFTLTGLVGGTLPFVLILLAAVTLLILALLPNIAAARPVGVVLCAIVTLLPIAMTLMTFTILRSTAAQPALWTVLVAAAAGLCAAIAIAESGAKKAVVPTRERADLPRV